MTICIPVKPLSVNQAWKGKRFKTAEYKAYARNVKLLLPRGEVIPEGRLQVSFTFYLSNASADWDNPVKPLQDVIFRFYGVNDSRIYRATVEKIIVPKGMEKTEITIMELPD